VEVLRKWRIPVFGIVDATLIVSSYLFALFFRYSFSIPGNQLSNLKNHILVIIAIYLITFYVFGMYTSLWSFARTDEFIMAISAGILAQVICLILLGIRGLGLGVSVQLLAGFLIIISTCSFRLSFRLVRKARRISGTNATKRGDNALIIGGGSAAAIIINEMKNFSESRYNPVAVIDDDLYKVGTYILGVKVVGDRGQIEAAARQYQASVILLAIPSISPENKKEILDICKRTDCRIQIIPRIEEMFGSDNLLGKVRDVDVEDLLGRDAIRLDTKGIKDYIEDRIVVVTGGGGSIGSELSRQIARFGPRKLIVIDIYENNAYDLQNELKYAFPTLDLEVLIASVRDKKRIDSIFSEYKPEVVFHAAAHKHVPLMEHSPSEAIKNNVFGTLNVAEAADRYGVRKFVMVSTDKAVNPTNIMGATKRICEMIIQSMDRTSKTDYVAVRFGNVLGSNGSVVPLFKRQIARGGPVTITHEDVTRFFMTIPEAAQLVIQAGAYAIGGEIFILDMGNPVKIYDLASDLIKLSGFVPGKDIKIEITGLRPGEKLYEELLMDEEGLRKTTHEKIFIAKPSYIDVTELKSRIDELRFLVDKGDKGEIAKKVSEIVCTYDISRFGSNQDNVSETS